MSITERWDRDLGLFELFAKARSFFDVHNDDLSVVTYTIDFYSCDKSKSVFRLRNGAITSPLTMRSERNESVGLAQVSFIFGDPYLYWSGDSGYGIVSFTLRPYAPNAILEVSGRAWNASTGTPPGAEWENTDSAVGMKIWELPTDLPPKGEPVTIYAVSAQTVTAYIELTGPLTSPIITNETNGSMFEYLGNISENQKVIVSENGSVTTTGGVISPYAGVLTARPGNNTFVLETDITTEQEKGQAYIRIRGAL